MPTTKKPRKKYRPRLNLANPVDLAIATIREVEARPLSLSQSEIDMLTTRNHVALHEILHGTPTLDDWNTITKALNVAIALDDQVYGRAKEVELFRALKAHATGGQRFYTKQVLRYSGTEMAAVKEALAIHDVQVAQATVGEMQDAVNAVFTSLTTGKNRVGVKQLAEGKYKINDECVKVI